MFLKIPKDSKEKKKIFIIFLIILVILFLLLYLFVFRNKEEDTTQNTDKSTSSETEDDTLTPEEELANLGGDDTETSSLGESTTMSIINPEGETFSMSQARMWQAEFEDIEIDESLTAVCHWKFYMNEYNEEVLYQEMENKSVISKSNPKGCTFTSTFIDVRGELRVVLSVDIKNSYGEILESYTAERSYTVL
jgi:hypothetical protein